MKNRADFDAIDVPQDDTVIWRYMSFDRFKQLIESSELYFARVDQFSDFTEGMIGEKTVENSVIEAISQGATEDKAIVDTMSGAFYRTYMQHKYFFASCWAGCNYQSNLLWRSYGSLASSSDFQFKVAIKTTVGRLKKAFINPPEDLVAGYAKYFESRKDDPHENSNNEFYRNVFLKRIEYRDEREIRFAFLNQEYHRQIQQTSEGKSIILLNNFPETPTGIPLKITLHGLILEIYVEAIPINKNLSMCRAEEMGRMISTARERQRIIEDLLRKNGLGAEEIYLSEVL